MRVLPIVWIGFGLGVELFSTSCGTSCEEIRRERDAFEARRVEPHDPDAQLVLPFTFVDRALARELGRRPPVEFRLPIEKLGLALTMTAKLEALHARAAEPGRLGVRAEVGLYEGGAKVVDVAIDGAALVHYRGPSGAPGDAGHIAIDLRKDSLGALASSTTGEGKRRLAAWLRGELPGPLKKLVADDLVGLVADELLVFFANEIWPRARADLLGEKPVFFSTDIALPGLPIAAVQARSRTNALVLDLTTALPVSMALEDEASTPIHERVALLMTGQTAAEVVNHGMRSGLVPSRFGSDGKPKPDGHWEARVGWRAQDANPLAVHLWRLDGQCKSALVRGSLSLRVQDDKLHVEVSDGRLERIRGPAFVEAFAWWEMLWGDAFEVVEEIATKTQLEVDGRTLDVRLSRAELNERRLLVELDARW